MANTFSAMGVPMLALNDGDETTVQFVGTGDASPAFIKFPTKNTPDNLWHEVMRGIAQKKPIHVIVDRDEIGGIKNITVVSYDGA